jgi:hypothetical protein
MRPATVLAAGGVVLVVALAAVLLPAEPRQAGSNYVPEFGPVIELRGADRHCQEEGLVPRDAAALRVRVGTYGRPTPAIRATMADVDGPVFSAGRLPAGRREGIVVVPLDPPVEESRGGVEACIATGRGGRTVMYGAGERIRFEWLREGEESWLELLPTVAHRFGLGKGLAIGAWLLVLAAVLLVGAIAVAARVAARELAR